MRGFWLLMIVLCAVGAVAWWMGGGDESDSPLPAIAPTITAPVEPTVPGVAPPPVAPPVITPPPTTTPPAEPSAAKGLPIGMDATIPAATITGGNIERSAAGDLLCDGKFTIMGEGTRERPYQVSWELLTSAEDTYVPRLGLKAIPQRVALLQGKWVSMSGYIAFPLVATESDEVLLMLNQWDGCCIGVPPTPYDAVEVRLESAIEVGKRHQINYATITGIFTIDPYVADTWLVGLYLMENASITMDL